MIYFTPTVLFLQHEFSVLQLHLLPWLEMVINLAVESMDFQRAVFGLLRRLVERVPWQAVLEGKGVQQGCTIFCKVQEHAVPKMVILAQRNMNKYMKGHRVFMPEGWEL